ncbi:hypothetical protein KK488_03420 [Sphingobium sp. H33]|uniref:Uncharacterized protein n=2 Tax=Sphingobium nicotianae TaxID=2782607 RepID=A0A9X1D9R1_9SPHN|nr:hypothetical protein [Sphingobium nicotianae]
MSATLLPTVSFADDPRDPAMRNPAARARDRAMTKRLNQGQLAYVRQRDAKTLRTYREAQKEHEGGYADAHADYLRKMAAWRHAVSACKAGQWEYCDN